MIAGKIPKLNISTSESICIPNFFSASVLPFLVRATIPSNESKAPHNNKHVRAATVSP